MTGCPGPSMPESIMPGGIMRGAIVPATGIRRRAWGNHACRSPCGPSHVSGAVASHRPVGCGPVRPVRPSAWFAWFVRFVWTPVGTLPDMACRVEPPSQQAVGWCGPGASRGGDEGRASRAGEKGAPRRTGRAGFRTGRKGTGRREGSDACPAWLSHVKTCRRGQGLPNPYFARTACPSGDRTKAMKRFAVSGSLLEVATAMG